MFTGAFKGRKLTLGKQYAQSTPRSLWYCRDAVLCEVRKINPVPRRNSHFLSWCVAHSKTVRREVNFASGAVVMKEIGGPVYILYLFACVRRSDSSWKYAISRDVSRCCGSRIQFSFYWSASTAWFGKLIIYNKRDLSIWEACFFKRLHGRHVILNHFMIHTMYQAWISWKNSNF